MIVSSFGKSFHITGWKVGYVVAPEKLMNELKKVHQYLVFTVNSLSQHVLSEYLRQKNVNNWALFIDKKETYLEQEWRVVSLTYYLVKAHFQLASYANLSQESDVDFCHKLVEKFKLAAIPISVFSAHEEKEWSYDSALPKKMRH